MVKVIKIKLIRVNMKNKLKRSLNVNLVVLTMLLSIFFVSLGDISTLYAKNKKQKAKIIKAKKLKKQYANLHEEYQLTMEEFLHVLKRLMIVYDDLHEKVSDLDKKCQKYEHELFLVREVFNKKAQEDETFRVGFDLPFMDETVYVDGIRVERHPIGYDQ